MVMKRLSLTETDTTEARPGVHLAQLAGGERMTVQHFAVEPGAVIESHSHPHEQTRFIYEGQLVFVLAEDEQVCAVGDSYAIAGGERHRIENHGETTARGVDIFSPPRENPAWARE